MALLEHQYSLPVFPFQLHLPNHTCIGLALPLGAVKKKNNNNNSIIAGDKRSPQSYSSPGCYYACVACM